MGTSVGDGYKGLAVHRILESCFSQAHPTSTTTQLKVNNFTRHNSQHVSLLLLQLQLLRLLRLLLLLFLRRRSQPEKQRLTALCANLRAALNAPLEACSDCDVIQQHLRQIAPHHFHWIHLHSSQSLIKFLPSKLTLFALCTLTPSCTRSSPRNCVTLHNCCSSLLD